MFVCLLVPGAFVRLDLDDSTAPLKRVRACLHAQLRRTPRDSCLMSARRLTIACLLIIACLPAVFGCASSCLGSWVSWVCSSLVTRQDLDGRVTRRDLRAACVSSRQTSMSPRGPEERKSEKGGREGGREGGCRPKPAVRSLTRPPPSGAHLQRWGVAQHAPCRRVLAVEALPAMGPPPPLPLAVGRRLRCGVRAFPPPFPTRFPLPFPLPLALGAFAFPLGTFAPRLLSPRPVFVSCLGCLARDASASSFLSPVASLPAKRRRVACVSGLFACLETPRRLSAQEGRDETRLVCTPAFPPSVPLEHHVGSL